MRLINADLLKKSCKCTGEFKDNFKCVSLSELAKVIDNQPTAFDIDKVIEQLEQRRANFDCKSCKYNDGENTICSGDCSDALIDDLIKIVKEGGLNEQTD